MKALFSITTIVLLLTLFSCRKESRTSASVVKDCSGVYLRLDGKDYQVCNYDKLDGYADGARVTVTFKRIDDCPDNKGIVQCMLYHQNEGWVKVINVD